MDKEIAEHRAFMVIEYNNTGHAECHGCDWVGPTRDGAVRVAYDCGEHEQEFTDDED